MSEQQSSARAQVLVKVSRAYEHHVMNDVDRSDYVEAMVAVALADCGWTCKDPWDGWGLRARIRCPAGGEAVGRRAAVGSSPRAGEAHHASTSLRGRGIVPERDAVVTREPALRS